MIDWNLFRIIQNYFIWKFIVEICVTKILEFFKLKVSLQITSQLGGNRFRRGRHHWGAVGRKFWYHARKYAKRKGDTNKGGTKEGNTTGEGANEGGNAKRGGAKRRNAKGDKKGGDANERSAKWIHWIHTFGRKVLLSKLPRAYYQIQIHRTAK